jgi:hypothetical protein
MPVGSGEVAWAEPGNSILISLTDIPILEQAKAEYAKLQ